MKKKLIYNLRKRQSKNRVFRLRLLSCSEDRFTRRYRVSRLAKGIPPAFRGPAERRVRFNRRGLLPLRRRCGPTTFFHQFFVRQLVPPDLGLRPGHPDRLRHGFPVHQGLEQFADKRSRALKGTVLGERCSHLRRMASVGCPLPGTCPCVRQRWRGRGVPPRQGTCTQPTQRGVRNQALMTGVRHQLPTTRARRLHAQAVTMFW